MGNSRNIDSSRSSLRQNGDIPSMAYGAAEDAELGQMPNENPRLGTQRSFSQMINDEGRRSIRLLRLDSLLGGKDVRETFYCQVCMENVDVGEGMVLRGESCTHRFCYGCLEGHLTARITDGQVDNPCPSVGKDGCGNFATEEDVKDLCEPDILDKFIKFKKMKQSSDFRECPYTGCNHMQKGSRWFPKMKCESCNRLYCFYHSNAHEGMNCRQYAATDRFKEQVTEKVIAKTTKKCPNCKSNTEKNGGCNHMTCAHCKFQWCWLCSKEYQSNHYSANNNNGCPGGQFADPAVYNSRLAPLLARARKVQAWIAGIVGTLTVLANSGLIFTVWLICLAGTAMYCIKDRHVRKNWAKYICTQLFMVPLVFMFLSSALTMLILGFVWLLLFCVVYLAVLPYSLWQRHQNPELHQTYWTTAKGLLTAFPLPFAPRVGRGWR